MKSGASEVNSEKCLLRASIVVQRARCLPGPPPAPMSVDAGGKMGPPGAKDVEILSDADPFLPRSIQGVRHNYVAVRPALEHHVPQAARA